MSLWLQTALVALDSGDYARLRRDLLPVCPIPVPACLIRELEFAERRCLDRERDPLFPIRFLWLLEANEQRRFGLPVLGRSLYHPEKLLEVWERASADPQYLRDREAGGARFDFAEKALDPGRGWILIGDRFVEDLMEVEAALRVQMLFPDLSNPGQKRQAFRQLRANPGPGPD